MRIKLLILIFFAFAIFSLYSCVGYFILALNSGKLVEEIPHYFMGNFMLSIIFLLMFLLSTIIIIILIHKKMYCDKI